MNVKGKAGRAAVGVYQRKAFFEVFIHHVNISPQIIWWGLYIVFMKAMRGQVKVLQVLWITVVLLKSEHFLLLYLGKEEMAAVLSVKVCDMQYLPGLNAMSRGGAASLQKIWMGGQPRWRRKLVRSFTQKCFCCCRDVAFCGLNWQSRDGICLFVYCLFVVFLPAEYVALCSGIWPHLCQCLTEVFGNQGGSTDGGRRHHTGACIDWSRKRSTLFQAKG